MLHLFYFSLILPSLTLLGRPPPNSVSAMQSGEVTRILSILLDGYDKKIRPGYLDNRPTEVNISVEILGMGDIDDSRMEYSLHCYFRQFWRDPRLSFETLDNHTTQYLPLNAQQFLTDIWRPDTYIVNGKRSFLHHLTVPNKLLRINRDGKILLSQRLTIIARCPLRLRKFPMDSQECFLEIGSLGHDASEITYSWKVNETLVTDHQGLELPDSDSEDSLAQMSQFTLDAVVTYGRTMPADSQTATERGPQRNRTIVSRVFARFSLTRQQGYYVLQIYIPCTMIVMLSWVSFWINKEAAIARCSLGVMTVLALTTLRLGVRAELPVVHYATALDVFLLASFGFVMAALVEYIIIHFTHLMHVRKISAFQAQWGGRRINHGSQRQRRLKRAQMKMMKQMLPTTTFDEFERGETPVMHDGEEGEMDCRRVCYSPNGGRRGDTMAIRRFGHGRKVMMSSPSISSERSVQLDGDGEGGIHKTFGVPHKMAAIDSWAKIVFPLIYILFHGSYWTLYIWLIPDDA